MKTQKLSFKAVRIIATMVLIASLLHLGTPRYGVAAQRVSLKSESQVKSEAGSYDTAIREIARIETMKLTTEDEFTRVRAILDRQGPNLRFGRSKLIAIVLSDATFMGAARARTSTTKLAEEFALALAADQQSVFKLSGGAAVKDKMLRSLETDISLLRRVAEKIKRAASEYKSGHHAGPHSVAALQRDGGPGPALAVIGASLAVSAIMIVSPPLALALPFLVTAAVGGVITASIVVGATALLARVLENAGTDEGRDKVAACIKNAEEKHDACLANHPLVALMGGCLAEFLLSSAACLLLE